MLFLFGLLSFFVIALLAWHFKNQAKIKRALSSSLPSSTVLFLEQFFHPYKYLSDEQKKAIHVKIIYFMQNKNFWPLGEIEIDEKMKLLIAAHACLLTLNDKKIETFKTLSNIYIAPEAYIEKENTLDLHTMLPKHSARLGESRLNGPLVLSWDSIEESLLNWQSGQNVIFHEFAHKLDGDDHHMDGTPVLKKSGDYRLWKVLMTKTFLNLRKQVLQHQKSDIDAYGATNEAEFFAVTVEEFFTHPQHFFNHHPDLYNLFKNHFELDPLSWS